MHRFRISLTRLISEQGWTQQNFAARLGTDPANVSRWLSGKSCPDSTTVGRIIESLPNEYHGELLMAYLKDQIPPRFDTMVQVLPVEGSTVRPDSIEPELPEGMAPELKKQIVYFSKLALRSQEVRKIVELFYTVAHRVKRNEPKMVRALLEE